jgi:DNA-binding HxlR family transcriptional regulator
MPPSTLKDLEGDGRVIRKLFPEVPPRVDYEITDLGKSLPRPTQGLVDWAKAKTGGRSGKRNLNAMREIASGVATRSETPGLMRSARL